MQIKEIRKEKGIKQKELAEKIGVDVSVLSRYENGGITPSRDRLQKIAEVLEVTIDKLLYGSNSFIINKDNFKHIKGRKSVANVDDDTFYMDQSLAAAWALDNANGICELCKCKAPFNGLDGKPYLESHFITWLSKGGLPVPKNTVALCPNCHKKIHVLKDPADILELKNAASSHIDLYELNNYNF